MKDYTIIKPDPTLKNNLMAFGFMCGKGWYPIIIECLDKIQEIVNRDELDLQVTEVKEKFGELRIYVSTGTDEIYEIIDEAESKSKTTCELCGEKGRLVNDHGWWKTRCKECFESEE